jgi:hypothetical protein
MKRRLGKFVLDGKMLTDHFDLKGGWIWDAKVEEANRVTLLIEHPDFPEVEENQFIPEILCIYRQTFGENGIITQVERITPPKRSE